MKPCTAQRTRRGPLLAGMFALVAIASAAAGEPAVRAVPAEKTMQVVAARQQPEEYRYLAFPSLLRVGVDELWIAYKAGRSHATDAGSAIEVVSHRLSSGETKLVQRMPAPPPQLYQMGEFARFPDGSIGLYVDVQSVGWDGRHYRAGAAVIPWNRERNRFAEARPFGVVGGVLYGYPLDFVSENGTTWQLSMAFGYHLPGGRWSVDALRSDDSGRSWKFVRNLTEEFGNIRANESAFVRHGDGFIVTTRGYDRIERLHRVDAEFHVKRQADLTGKYAFLNSYIGRPRLFVRDGHGYMIGRNWTKPTGASGERGATASEMQLCLFRFDLETLALTSCVVLDNAEQRKVTDGYYAVVDFSGSGDETRLHVITYKAMAGQPPDIVRMDYRWSAVK